jgi:hypothetical protein
MHRSRGLLSAVLVDSAILGPQPVEEASASNPRYPRCHERT